jgi:hypothetical protein
MPYLCIRPFLPVGITGLDIGIASASTDFVFQLEYGFVSLIFILAWGEASRGG